MAIILTLGQLLSISLDNNFIILVNLLMILYFKSLGILYILLLGQVYSFDFNKNIEIPKEETVYLIKVIDELSYPSVGKVIIKSKILDSKFTYLKNKKIICTGKYSPWSNSGKIIKGGKYKIKAKLIDFKSDSLFDYDNLNRAKGFLSNCKFRYISNLLQGDRSLIDQFKEGIINKIYSKLGSSDSISLVLSVTLGFNNISKKTSNVFKASGLSHLLVVSGFHIGLVFYSLYFIISRLLFKSYILSNYLNFKYCGYLFSYFITLFYCLIVGLEGSALRAFITLSIIVISKIIERDNDFINLIILSYFIMISIVPGSFLMPGFQLSYFALLGIYFGLKKSSKYKLLNYIRVNLYIYLFTSLIVVFWFEKVSLLSLPINLIITPIMAFLVCKLGLLSILLIYLGLDQKAHLFNLISVISGYLRSFLLLITDNQFSYFSVSEYKLYFLILFSLVIFILLLFDSKKYRNVSN